MNIRTIQTAAIVVALASFANSAHAQTSASQQFKVVVPSKISITAPAAATITHDETDNAQAFPAQSWVVKGNIGAGVNVSFATQDTFKHDTLPFERNAALALALGTTQGPATWTVTTAADQTDYASSDNVATVAASSNGVGRANFDLTVSFITEEFGVFAAGDYNMTVVGTVAAN